VETLRQRLGQLRMKDAATAPRPVVDADLAERLQRLRLLAAERRGEGGQVRAEALPGVEIAPGLHVHEVRVSALRARLAGLELPSVLSPPWDPDACVDRSRLRLFDTETSGLSGGAGLKVFLLGVLRWQEDGWLLRQYLMTRPCGESALVAAWVDECRDAPWLVSYNGKRFDVPALRTLETLHAQDAGAASAAHWDLLYPVRRAFRGIWPDCRLTTAERMLTGKARGDDLPGSEAPRAWREFLHTGATHDLLRVMQHNRYDLEALLRVMKALLAHSATAPRPRHRARAPATRMRATRKKATMELHLAP
jgi:uncharacterized protein YprB with RNaseH-like and TPR domain